MIRTLVAESILCTAATLAAAGELTLIRDGQSAYAIVTPAEYDAYAARIAEVAGNVDAASEAAANDAVVHAHADEGVWIRHARFEPARLAKRYGLDSLR